MFFKIIITFSLASIPFSAFAGGASAGLSRVRMTEDKGSISDASVNLNQVQIVASDSALITHYQNSKFEMTWPELEKLLDQLETPGPALPLALMNDHLGTRVSYYLTLPNSMMAEFKARHIELKKRLEELNQNKFEPKGPDTGKPGISFDKAMKEMHKDKHAYDIYSYKLFAHDSSTSEARKQMRQLNTHLTEILTAVSNEATGQDQLLQEAQENLSKLEESFRALENRREEIEALVQMTQERLDEAGTLSLSLNTKDLPEELVVWMKKGSPFKNHLEAFNANLIDAKSKYLIPARRTFLRIKESVQEF